MFVRKFTKEEFGTKEGILGKGTFGTVFKYGNYAVKTAFTLDFSVVKEVGILKYLNHPNIVKPVMFQLVPRDMLVLPLADGTLRDIKLGLQLRKWCFYQIVRAIAYCHVRHVWHLDLKVENILYVSKVEPRILIADFGNSFPYARPSKANEQLVVSPGYRAPEIGKDPYYTNSVDIYAIGKMLLYCIDVEYFTKNRVPGNLDYYERDLLRQMLKRDRINIFECMWHPYFDDYREIIEKRYPVALYLDRCGAQMAKELSVGNAKLDKKEIRKALEVLDLFTDDEERKYKILIYTLTLVKNTKYYPACLFIGCCLYSSSEITFNDIADQYNLASKNLQNQVNFVLTDLDFNIIFPTAYDFIKEYTKKIKITILEICITLMYGFPQFNSEEIARLTIECVTKFQGKETIYCLINKPKLLSENIYKYIFPAPNKIYRVNKYVQNADR